MARWAFEAIRPGGALALLWNHTPFEGDNEWQVVGKAVVREWTGRLQATERVPRNFRNRMAERPHEAVLVDAGFDVLGKFERPALLTWTPDSLAGFVYSTSVLARPVMGEQASAFEQELRDRLLAIEPSGIFRQLNLYAYHFARRPD